MSKHYVSEAPSRRLDGGDHRSILALLPEYVTLCILEQRLAPEWQPLEQHLLGCPVCRSEADALRQLVAESYTEAFLAAPAPAPPDLRFLGPVVVHAPPGGPAGAGMPARKIAFQPIVIQFSAALLPRIRVQMAARTGGVHLRYAYEIPPTDDTIPTITVEVLVHDDQPSIGLVRVCVEHPDRSPFDQAGTCVTLQIGGAQWQGLTDQNGVTAFHDIPLDQIEQWQITVAPEEPGDPGT